MSARDLTSKALAAGALGFGLYGIAAPGSLARLAGADDPAVGRELGLRDLGNALLFAAGARRAALVQRLLYDVSDAVRFGRRKPKVGAGALAAAALGLYALAEE